MGRTSKKVLARLRRKRRVRKKIFGTPERPRLSVFRSCKHIYAQIIDDVHGKTLVAASSLTPQIREKVLEAKKEGGKTAAAKVVGEFLGQRALEAGIKKVVFDRSGYKYHGRVKALADGARAAGLEF
ncbi:ribosomal protein L18 [Thermodesulfatator indicus DSM 15286]|uniref:Large ribosomal subunit protein uL18 n=1 Tax=Thermodesulfatator indicus (strain DSM 15286 / JCM 11887 / CIR29812) TaxID=667014 RepID=F8AA53_THEID|nr:50S ribosomal protein L18 [Thermodesulfatator indicus]AEH45341.1 ribosomal protein L18 [Thermodesulfatator indicus DSM 15286]